MLTYIADITVNGHPETQGRPKPAEAPRPPEGAGQTPPGGTKTFLDDKGAKAVADWMLGQDRLLLTDTTMRDSHQSASGDADALDRHDPRRARLCGQPAGTLQCRMLGRGHLRRGLPLLAGMPVAAPARPARGDAQPSDADAAAGVQRGGLHQLSRQRRAAFVHQAAETGVDVFRVFDSLNWVENMRVAMDAVIESGKICEGTICYTGDILDPDRAKYDLKYYVGMARELQDAGAHVLGLKDMAGLLKPASASVLVRALKDEIDIPVHFHTHDTSGIAGHRSLRLPRPGSMRSTRRWTRSRAARRSPASARSSRRFATRPATPACRSSAFANCRITGNRCARNTSPSRAGLQTPASEVYLHEMPGGQFTNLKAQARSLGLEENGPRSPAPMRT